MPRYPLGQPVRVSTTVRDSTGALIDAGTLSLTVRKPDGVTDLTYSSPTHDSTGTYHQDVPAADLTALGHYQYVWTSTGAGAGVSPPNTFDVFDPFEPTVLSLQDAKDTLDIPAATTSRDTEIAVMAATVEEIIETYTGGPIVNRSVSEFVPVGQGYRSLTVRYRPLVSVTSITDNATGTALDLADLDVDTDAGIIRRRLQLPFWARGPYYTVVYVAGWGTAVPAPIGLAARIILQHLWEVQRGQQRPMFPGDDVSQPTGMAYSVPNRAVELLAPYAYEVYV